MSSYQQIVDLWTDEVRRDLIKGYEETRRRASGNWADELEEKKDVTPFKIKVTFLAPKYTEQLEDGRGPNKNQDPKAIRGFVGFAGSTFLDEWVKNKGVSANPFAVAYKIAREGYEGRPFVSKVFNQERVNELINKLGTAIATNIRSDIVKQFK